MASVTKFGERFTILLVVQKYPPIHPGKILYEEFILCFGLTPSSLAHAIGVPRQRIHEIVHKKRGISMDTALRLAKYFGNALEFWIEIQTRYELAKAKRKLKISLKPRGTF